MIVKDLTSELKRYRKNINPKNKILELECKTITPICCGGWNQEYDKSLIIRPSEIKALWRWWVRYLLSHFNLSNNQRLEILEKIFGSTEKIGNYKIVIEIERLDNNIFINILNQINNIINTVCNLQLINKILQKSKSLEEFIKKLTSQLLIKATTTINKISNNYILNNNHIPSRIAITIFKNKNLEEYILYNLNNNYKIIDINTLRNLNSSNSAQIINFLRNVIFDFTRQYIYSNYCFCDFKIRLYNIKSDNNYDIVAITTLITALLLFGVGKNSRKGFGKIWINEINISNSIIKNEDIKKLLDIIEKITSIVNEQNINNEFVHNLKNKLNELIKFNYLQLQNRLNIQQQNFKFEIENVLLITDNKWKYYENILKLISILNLKTTYKYITMDITKQVNIKKDYWNLWGHKYDTWIYGLPRAGHTIYIFSKENNKLISISDKVPAKLFFVPFSNNKENIRVILIIKIFDTIRNITLFTHKGRYNICSVNISYNINNLILQQQNNRINYNCYNCCERCNYCFHKNSNIYEELKSNIDAFLKKFNIGEVK